MNTAIAHITSLDPVADSRNWLLAIVFPHSTSKNFPLALKLAERADQFKKGDYKGKTFYLACISRETKSVLMAKALLEYVSGWKGTRVFISGGEYRSAYTVMRVLDCYSQAIQCSDPRAHCHVVIDHPKIVEMKYRVMSSALSFSNIEPAADAYDNLESAPKILSPCRYISAYRDAIQPEHPSPIQDQIQAAAVRHGCHWCPLFDPRSITLLGAQTTGDRNK